MFTSDPLAEAGAILFEKAERRLAALLGKHGAQHPGGLPRPLQLQLAERAHYSRRLRPFPQQATSKC